MTANDTHVTLTREEYETLLGLIYTGAALALELSMCHNPDLETPEEQATHGRFYRNASERFEEVLYPYVGLLTDRDRDAFDVRIDCIGRSDALLK